jgi:hypothetical protein
MQIDYVKISCKEDVHICRTIFAKQMEQNLHGTTSWWKTYGKWLLTEDLEVRDEVMKFLRFEHALNHCQCNKICPNLPKFIQRQLVWKT